MQALILVAIFVVKHFVADFLLQNEYMLGKFKPGKDSLLPLLTHVSVGSIITMGIADSINPQMSMQVVMFDFLSHGLMDYVKAQPHLLGRYKPLTKRDFDEREIEADNGILFAGYTEAEYQKDMAWEKRKQSNKKFWWALGFDQMFHHLCDVFIVFMLLNN